MAHQESPPETTTAVSPGIPEDTAVTGSSPVPPRGDQRGRKKPKKPAVRVYPGTKPGTTQPDGDLAELVRGLASLTPEERETLTRASRRLKDRSR